MRPEDRRGLIDSIRELPAKHRAWLRADDIDLFAYYGFGVVLNSAQLEAARALFTWPPGTTHVRSFANRTGKTTGLVIEHAFVGWRKWRYENPDLDDWLGYTYRTLHAAPLGKLAGKAWELADALISGTAIQQQSPITNRQRPALLRPFYKSRSGRLPDGSEGLWVECANGSIIDFLSTHDGAGRMESETWRFISWDEYLRQQPIEDVPLLFDQTFLPRSSDYMAPIVLSSTVTEDAEPYYQEILDIAEASAEKGRKDWNVMTFGREANFSQSMESIERQQRMSIDPAIAARSVEGKTGEGGRGTLYPHFLLQEAFDEKMPVDWSQQAIDYIHTSGRRVVTTYDHAARGDLNVALTFDMPWPLTHEIADESIGGIRGIGQAERRSGHHLTPDLQARFVLDEIERFGSDVCIVDATSEGGALVYSATREGAPNWCHVVPMIYNAKRDAALSTNKEVGLQMLQRLFAWGLADIADEEGWTQEWPDIPRGRHFGLLRLPFSGRWIRVRREVAVLRRDDEKLKQDRAMCLVMLAWWLEPMLRSRRRGLSSFSIVGQRPRPKRRGRVVAITR